VAQGATVRWSENGKSIRELVNVPPKGIVRLVADF
jgi:hypothetical protein